MPQLNGADGDDLGANDELIAFKDEGEQEEKRNVAAEGDLDDVKSSLVNESETNSSSDSEADRRPRTDPGVESRARHSQLFEEALRRRQQDGGLFQPSPYVGYPFFMIPDLGNLCSPYLTNGALTPSRTYLPFQWPLLDVPGRSSIRDTATPTHLSSSVPVMQHLHPLLYSPEAFSPQRASPGYSPDTGVSRTSHACYPVSPGGVAQITHPLGWLQGQSVYPISGGFSPAALAMNASMSSLVSGSFSPRLVPPPASIPHPAIVPTLKQEPGGSSQPGKAEAEQQKEEERRPHIKKPLNAFMLFMREERGRVVNQCNVKESATINQILGQRWHSLTKDQQAKYYELARKERLLHSKLYPGWSARDNYGKKKKRKRMKSDPQSEVPDEDFPLQLKRPRIPAEETPHTHTHTHTAHTHTHTPHTHTHTPHTHTPHTHTHTPLSHTHTHTHPRPHLSQPHAISHLSHSHLSQGSPASSLDSPATPTTALASPAAPAPTNTEITHSSSSSSSSSLSSSSLSSSSSSSFSSSSPFAEQLQPLSLTTKPHRTAPPISSSPPPPPPPSSSSSSSSSSLPPPPSSSLPPPPPLPPFLVPPPTSAHQSGSSHGALTFPLRRTNQL